ncbi:hypothetical protein B9Z19DRAFT_1136843 [Tuber borchii]|uniref:Uncharacterized protein n=1 Tax=Tuber borchii TaxID=42251 RepID=A0A2T6ZB80_TUBBO|nr:hypothetical protein B9Z19DRAFT_1136843 [Tuber borchii]
MVKLLLSNGADPNLLGEVDKVLLRAEQRGRSLDGMEQTLLDWGMRPSAENIPLANPLHPLSWLEVEHVRNLLNQHFQMASRGNAISKHLPDTILRRAQYLPQISAGNDNPQQITKYTKEEAYLRICVYFALTGRTQRIPLQKNFHGSRCLRTHKVIWDIYDADSMVSNMIKALMPGDELRGQTSGSGMQTDGQQDRPGGGVNVKPTATHRQHANGVTASDGVPTNGYQPAAVSNLQSEKPPARVVTTPSPPKKRGFRNMFYCCFSGS